jgi:hypothetical protein
VQPLDELQRSFMQGLYDRSCSTAITGSISSNTISSEMRLHIYRNTVFSNITHSLKAIYPVIHGLVGTEFFDYAATTFIATCPPVSGNLDHYGERFGTFLTQFPDAGNMPYLGDVARLEWACHLAYHAADSEPLAASALAGLAPEVLGELVFTAAPAMALIESEFPLYRIWEINQPGYAGDMQVQLNQGTCYCLVVRQQDFTVILQPLDKAMFYFLYTITSGNRLYSAYEVAEAIDENFNLAEALALLVTHNIASTAV